MRLYLHASLLIVGGALAIAAFVLGRKPANTHLVHRLLPFQAFVGVGLLALAVMTWAQAGLLGMFRSASALPIAGAIAIGSVMISLVLGTMFGVPQTTRWRRGTPYHLVVGVLALGAGVLGLLLQLRVLSPS